MTKERERDEMSLRLTQTDEKRFSNTKKVTSEKYLISKIPIPRWDIYTAVGVVSLPAELIRAKWKSKMKNFAPLGFLLLLITFCHGRVLNSLQTEASHWRKLPCPNPEDILPCTCTVDEDSRMDLDCSRVASEEELDRVFSSTFRYVPKLHHLW